MRYFIFTLLSLALYVTLLVAQTEYANVTTISGQASYNDFADIDLNVTAGAGYYWFFSAVQYIDWQSGGNWLNIVQVSYDDDFPYDGYWHTWGISNKISKFQVSPKKVTVHLNTDFQ